MPYTAPRRSHGSEDVRRVPRWVVITAVVAVFAVLAAIAVSTASSF